MSSKNLGTLVALAIAMALLFGLRGALSRDPTERNWEIFTEMQYSAAYEPNSPNPVFANGSTQQQLPEGVVPRGREWFPYAATEQDAARAGRELKNPFAATDAEALQQGGKLYAVYCALCHGGSGDGKAPVTLRGMVAPPSLGAVRAKTLADGQLFHILTRGQGNMSGYAAQLTARERWAVVTYVRKLQGGKP